MEERGGQPTDVAGNHSVSPDEEVLVRNRLEGVYDPSNVRWVLEPGDTVKRVDVHKAYGGSRQSGIVTFTSIADIAVFTDLKSGARHGYDRYEGLQEDGTFSYTGQGQRGDQVFKRGNLALREANKDGRTIRLFTVEGTWVTYVGSFATGDPTYWIRRIPDSQGNERNGIIFNLEPVDTGSELLVPPETLSREPKLSTWHPPETSDFVVMGSATEEQGERTVTRVEFELQSAFGQWLTERRMHVQRLQLVADETIVEPDLYVPEHGWVVEAKRSTSREHMRMAIGQVLDYARLAGKVGLPAVPVILLPGWPVRDMVELAQDHGICVVVRDESSGGFIRLTSQHGQPVVLPQGDQVLPTVVV